MFHLYFQKAGLFEPVGLVNTLCSIALYNVQNTC
jgi:hypothetical protein